MGAKSRRKGAAFEREVAAVAREHGFTRAARYAPMQAGYSTRFADVLGVGRLAIECKRLASGSLAAGRSWVEETVYPGYVPVAVCRDDRGEALAVLRLTDLLAIERQALGTVPPVNGWDAHEQAERAMPETAGKDPAEPA